jgi:hypothetical protein
MVWGLKLTAAEGFGYAKQFGAGMVISLMGGILIFLGSIIFTTLVFPHYFHDLEVMGREVMRSQGKSEAEIASYLTQQAQTQTPFLQALFGLIGTLGTGLIASLLIGIIFRKK